jgi:predicted transcriptional regulator
MHLELTPEAEAKLNELAQRTRRGTDELLVEAVDHLVAYNEWYERKVNGSIAAADRGETVPDDDGRVEFRHVNFGYDPDSGTAKD